MNDRNFHIRGAGERVAINTPIQGTAADIIKLAMVNIQRRLDDRNLKSLMNIQVHDELIFDAPNDEMEEMKGILLELMPSSMELAVPLKVEVKMGRSWGDME
ncbi:MAG: hypothetical protein FJ319_12675 [SAR202 cluster bacterium]|nr:hypothetical protein [SAR202 cluster bacterium]